MTLTNADVTRKEKARLWRCVKCSIAGGILGLLCLCIVTLGLVSMHCIEQQERVLGYAVRESIAELSKKSFPKVSAKYGELSIEECKLLAVKELLEGGVDYASKGALIGFLFGLIKLPEVTRGLRNWFYWAFVYEPITHDFRHTNDADNDEEERTESI